ncbi:MULTISPECIES: transketolase-like TK C-terminal-containing protein [Serratia]|uniref:transketolase-like TK C-terminal-containing protein n=1 Tax=Serratia TaxID=613 RepID=UPI000B5F276E|nr:MULTISPECIES: pyruvate dehydrogenase (lipoamide) [Serratia]ASM22120.1 pyruvate dehydrogenase (lipoamide) [Serratia marcescens]ASM26893.1 pyruvate dehydrogenase (lipoamide) [Serratia marcescens]
MSPQRITLPAASARTKTLAEACIRKMTSVSQKAGASRPSSSAWTAQTLDELNASGDIWLIDGRRRAEPPSSHYATAWPLWFGHQSERYEKPLFYFVNTPSVDMLRGLEPETNRKGIFISDADTGSADLPKGVQAWFPLQLTAMPGWLPFDPANARETGAILHHALHALYLEGTRKMVYLATNADNGPLSSGEPFVAEQAFKGMYRVAAAADSPLQVRLCGAGRALARVQQAAKVLKNWGIASEIWSCPSYTRLAQDAELADMQRQDSGGECHLKTCLGTGNAPVVAVTDYSHLIANQLRRFIPARFAAVGSDSRVRGEIHYPQAEWIALCALKLLADEQKIPSALIADALRVLHITPDA